MPTTYLRLAPGLYISVLLLCLGLPTLGGCSLMAARTTRPVVSAGLDEMNTPQNHEQIRSLINATELEALMGRITHAMAVDMIDEATAPEREERLKQLSRALADELADAAAGYLETDLGPAVREELRQGVTELVSALASGPNRARLETLLVQLSTELIRQVGPTLSTELSRALSEEFAPLLRSELTAMIEGPDSLTRAATREAMNGMGDALEGEFGEQLHAFLAVERQALLTDANRIGSNADRWLERLLIALTAVLLGVTANGIRAHRRWKRSDQALQLLTSTVKSLDNRPGVKTLVREVKDRCRIGAGGKYLREFIERRPELKADYSPSEEPPPVEEPTRPRQGPTA